MNPQKIFIFCNKVNCSGDNHHMIAISEMGNRITSHISSSIEFGKFDMASNNKHEIYKENFPQGYELIWEDHGEISSEECKKAIKRGNDSIIIFGD